MLKIATPLFALAVAFAPAAIADAPAEFSVELTYDSALLASSDGASEVLTSLKAQAKAACTYSVPLMGVEAVDRSCAKRLVNDAIVAIMTERNAEGLETAEEFAQLATVELAAL